MGKKINKSDVNEICEHFSKHVCPKLFKVNSNDCKFDSECNCLRCMVLYLMKNYKLEEK